MSVSPPGDPGRHCCLAVTVIGTATSLPNLQDIVATLVVAARVRNDQEETVIRQILATVFKRTVDPEKLLSLGEETSSVTRPLLSASTCAQFPALAWTRDMRRMGGWWLTP